MVRGRTCELLVAWQLFAGRSSTLASPGRPRAVFAMSDSSESHIFLAAAFKMWGTRPDRTHRGNSCADFAVRFLLQQPTGCFEINARRIVRFIPQPPLHLEQTASLPARLQRPSNIFVLLGLTQVYKVEATDPFQRHD